MSDATVGKATVSVGLDTVDLTRVLRIIAKHAGACADELSGATPDNETTSEPSVEDQIAEAKRLQAERHQKLVQQ